MAIDKKEDFENFDFKNLTADLTNSITDKLYVLYRPDLEEIQKQKKEQGLDNNKHNELLVAKVAESIKEKIDLKIVESVANSTVERVVEELEEQHYPKISILKRSANYMLLCRYIALAGLFAIAFIIGSLSALVAIKSFFVLIDTANY
jgi:hypothetical protein